MTAKFVDGVAHIRDLAARHVDIGANNCKLRTREAFDVPTNGTKTAAASWAAAPDQHKDADPTTAPANTFGWMTGGTRTLRNPRGAGHVVVNLGGGRILTPGGPADPTHWYETTAAELLRRWPNLRWVGWTRTIDGQEPPQPPTPKPTPPPKPTPLGKVTRGARIDQMIALGEKAAHANAHHPDRLRRINKALAALRSIKPKPSK